jgi:hypothetical protein
MISPSASKISMRPHWWQTVFRRSRMFVLIYILPLVPVVAQIAPELRDANVLYFDEALPDPVEARLLQATNVYSGQDMSMRVTTLPTGQAVRILGLNRELLLVQTTFRGNTVQGWVEAQQLPPLDPKLLETARKNKAFRDAVNQAIKDKKVIEGMTLEDVKTSLGKPNRTSFRKEANGRIDTWYYTAYESVPQYTYGQNALGQVVQILSYVKVPVGETVVEFAESRVVAVEQHTQDPKARGVTYPPR